ncbi:unnamed protein product [Closterium sp. Yama58-4]|nr:unnamed protein product [Closterium sp. Yama58-4]
MARNTPTPVKELRASLGPLPKHARIFCSDACLRRYLRARNWHVQRAERMLRNTLKWRDQCRPEEIRWVLLNIIPSRHPLVPAIRLFPPFTFSRHPHFFTPNKRPNHATRHGGVGCPIFPSPFATAPLPCALPPSFRIIRIWCMNVRFVGRVLNATASFCAIAG